MLMMNMRNINYFVQLCVGSNDDAANFNAPRHENDILKIIANEKQRKKMTKREDERRGKNCRATTTDIGGRR